MLQHEPPHPAGYRRTLAAISDLHRPSDIDARLCAEGCAGSWPCTTRHEADHALGNPRPSRPTGPTVTPPPASQTGTSARSRPARRILWNHRPDWERPSGGGGDIDELVMRDVALVHIEQMDDRCWWIALYPHGEHDRAPYWMGNFVADSHGRMRFVEQENSGVEWDQERSHQDTQRPRPAAGGRTLEETNDA